MKKSKAFLATAALFCAAANMTACVYGPPNAVESTTTTTDLAETEETTVETDLPQTEYGAPIDIDSSESSVETDLPQPEYGAPIDIDSEDVSESSDVEE